MVIAEFFVKYFYERSFFCILPLLNPAIPFHRWLALFLSLKAAYRLHCHRLFGLQDEAQEAAREGEGDGGRSRPRSNCLSHKDLILWLNRPTTFPNTDTSPVLQVIKAHSYDHSVAICGKRVCVCVSDSRGETPEVRHVLLMVLKFPPEHQSVFGHTACSLPRASSPLEHNPSLAM